MNDEQQPSDAEVVRDLEEMFGTAGWQKHLAPMLQQRMAAMTAALRNPSEERAKKLPDHYCRGQLDLADMVLNDPKLLIESILASQTEEKLAVERETRYNARATLGYGVALPTDDIQRMDEYV